MILTLKNIGKIKDARVELNGITVIAGENNTGKSTVGKTLFCIFNSFYKINEQIEKERRNAIRKALDIIYNPIYRGTRRLDIEELIEDLLQNPEIYKSNIKLLQNRIKEYLIFDKDIDKYVNEIFFDNLGFENTVKRISQIISIPDEEILKTVLSQKLNAEFNNQINNIYFDDEDGIVELNIKGTNIEILIQDNEVKNISKNINLNTEVIYIDDPFVLDEIRPSLPPLPSYLRTESYANHRLHLQSKLRDTKEGFGIEDAINKIIVTKKMIDITSKIDDVCSGKMIKSSNGKFGYKENNSDKALDIKNISTGLKTFVILKTLLLNGSIENNGTIVLDEPEIHLHPEWQILFAEIIVLLQKEFNMHILLNTHSPYFLRAIQVYSAKYEIADKCKYYLAENLGDKAIIKDVTTSIDEVYTKLAKPFETLEIERYSDD